MGAAETVAALGGPLPAAPAEAAARRDHPARARPSSPAPDPFARIVAPGMAEGLFAIDNLRCGGCVANVERALARAPGVVHARANLTAKRVSVRWREGESGSRQVVEALDRAGFAARAIEAGAAERDDRHGRTLLLSLGVAGFAASNVMMLSVAVWWGLVSDMEPATKAVFYWVSALIALPAVAFAGRPFFASALGALSAGRLNMDVPISLAVLLVTGMSLFQAARGSDQVYFDGATALLFFLLIGRFLDHVVRRRAQDAAQNLLALRAETATLVLADGSRCPVATEELRPGDVVAVAPGERIPVDGVIRAGTTDLDASLVTGESLPAPASPGAPVFAGVLNLSGAVEIETTRTGDETLLAEIARLMEAAEQGRARYVRLADRVSRFYAPAVHVLGAATFAGSLLAGLGWEEALTRAVAVLIVTCPCALALAVPAAQVAAAGRLMRSGILLKSADALDRLAEVDRVLMDKTGTLTLGRPALVDDGGVDAEALRRAARLAASSRHPLSRALLRAAEARLGSVPALPEVREIPGCGLLARTEAGETRLGSAAFAGAPELSSGALMELWLAAPGRAPVRFLFEDELRPDAAETVARLQGMGLPVELLSGDREEAVAAAARTAGVSSWRAKLLPGEKIARLDELERAGHNPLMVGDGLNDAPALAAAHASLSPAGASDIAQVAADVVFRGERLGAVAEAISMARRTRRVVMQNFALAFGYNALFVPLAVAGLVNPFVAALAMSTSSIAVTLNALRLRRP